MQCDDINVQCRVDDKSDKDDEMKRKLIRSESENDGSTESALSDLVSSVVFSWHKVSQDVCVCPLPSSRSFPFQ